MSKDDLSKQLVGTYLFNNNTRHRVGSGCVCVAKEPVQCHHEPPSCRRAKVCVAWIFSLRTLLQTSLTVWHCGWIHSAHTECWRKQCKACSLFCTSCFGTLGSSPAKTTCLVVKAKQPTKIDDLRDRFWLILESVDRSACRLWDTVPVSQHKCAPARGYKNINDPWHTKVNLITRSQSHNQCLSRFFLNRHNLRFFFFWLHLVCRTSTGTHGLQIMDWWWVLKLDLWQVTTDWLKQYFTEGIGTLAISKGF